MKILVSLSGAVFALAACGKTTSQDQSDSAQAGEKITFNEEIKSALSNESTTLPMAMIVKVDVDSTGKEDLSKAEVRTANVVSSDAQSTWNSGVQHYSPNDSDKLVIVNPPNTSPQFKSSGMSDYSYSPDSNLNVNSETYDSNGLGSNGVVVTGNNNYAYYNAVSNDTLNYDVTHYSYNVRPTPYQQRPNCNDQGNYSNEPNKPHCNEVGTPSYPYSNNQPYSEANNWNFSGESYYTYGYRPVYRSRNFSFGGLFGYWGFFVVPVRFVQGNSCYYIYQRPYHRRAY